MATAHALMLVLVGITLGIVLCLALDTFYKSKNKE